MPIDFADKCGILGQFWIEFREDEDLENFLDYNDIGLPMSYMIAEGLVQANPMGEQYINETFDHFIKALDLTDEDIKDVDDLNDILELAHTKKGVEPEDKV